MRSEKKTLYTLVVDNYAPGITRLTLPLMQRYAEKIGAELFVIRERKFPEWPVVFEKLQIHELGRLHENDWNIFFDADALVHPETIDFIPMLGGKQFVAHNGNDYAAVRWRYDEYFRRDGRNIGSCNWCTFGSDWNLDLWRPPDDLTPAEAISNIFPTVNELATIITPDHLVDDYVLSRNIAKYGLHFTTLIETLDKSQLKDSNFFWHIYTESVEKKVEAMKRILVAWQIDKLGIYDATILGELEAVKEKMREEQRAAGQ